jgi:D-serine deaminase-like pyridoxal phosphate-dependent protein
MLHQIPYTSNIGAEVQTLDTPSLLLDLDAFDRNVERMAKFFAAKPTALRPHAKTHKCPQVALRQIKAGAIGITCAKVSEAEVMARAGVNDILIANQVVGPYKIARLTELARACDLMIAVDDAGNVQELSEACCSRGVSLRILVEVDIGMGRCGVAPGKPVQELAQRVAQAPNLRFSGLLAYEGHLVSIVDPAEKELRVNEAFTPLLDTCETLSQIGLPADIVSAGGTGTYDITGTTKPVTEIEAGSYVFMDSTYRKVRPEFETALTVLATIISRPTQQRVIIDAGKKSLTTEFGLPEVYDAEGLELQRLSEEHGALVTTDAHGQQFRPGDKIQILPSHCCTTVNLYDALYVLQGGVVVDIWPIAARGCAQ